MTKQAPLQLDDIQGLVLRGFGALHQAGYLYFSIRDRASFRRWLHGLLQQQAIASAATPSAGLGANNTSLAFTAQGLQSLMADAWLESSFPIEFTEGMVQSQRSRLLGDLNANAPQHWRWGAQEGIHGVLMHFAQQKQDVESQLDAALAEGNGLAEVTRIYAELPKDRREPFGFVDGLSQPVIQGSQMAQQLSAQRARQLHMVATGEFILGYPDGSGELPRSPACSPTLPGGELLPPHPQRPELRDFGRNGTFVVMRQLAQDVSAFDDYVNAHSRDGLDIAEKMLGRSRDGRSLVDDPQAQGDNDFDYLGDPKGEQCPIGAHIRRCNPRSTVHARSDERALRVSNRHRIIRRGRVYKNDDGEIGLLFLGINASISRQFEFIQATWCNDPFFQGLAGEVDPIGGTRCEHSNRFTIAGQPYRHKLKDLPQWVTVKGGGYFFLPGMTALAALACAEDAHANGIRS